MMVQVHHPFVASVKELFKVIDLNVDVFQHRKVIEKIGLNVV
jgi:hypothetical protein